MSTFLLLFLFLFTFFACPSPLILVSLRSKQKSAIYLKYVLHVFVVVLLAAFSATYNEFCFVLIFLFVLSVGPVIVGSKRTLYSFTSRFEVFLPVCIDWTFVGNRTGSGSNEIFPNVCLLHFRVPVLFSLTFKGNF